MVLKMVSKYTKAHPDDVFPWDNTRGQATKCCYCKADCAWVMCSKCAELIAKGLPPQKPVYRPLKKGLYRRHTFGGEVR